MKPIYFLLLILAACNKPPVLEGFDPDIWKNDKLGCKGDRIALADTLIAQRDKLKICDDDAILNLLGKPEKSVYYKRGKKSYFYFIDKGSQCSDHTDKEGKKVLIEFNSLGYSILVMTMN